MATEAVKGLILNCVLCVEVPGCVEMLTVCVCVCVCVLKVLACHELPTWLSSVAVADVDQDGHDEVVVGCHDNSIHGLKISMS